MGENHFAPDPRRALRLRVADGRLAYLILQTTIIAKNGPQLCTGGGDRPLT
jgi:hypothetical protein